jgi:acyl carrier protein
MKAKAEIVDKVNKLLQEGFEIPADQLVATARLYEDLSLDSLDAVDMLVHLEDSIGVKVQGERFMQVRTLGDIHEMVYQVVLEANDPGSAVAVADPVGPDLFTAQTELDLG